MNFAAILAAISVFGPLGDAPKGYVCARAKEAPTVDGKLDDAAWIGVPWTDDFVDIEGSKKPNPTYRTRVKMLWDDQYFYIAAELQEPHVWATIKEHDAVIFQDNDFEIFLDPDGDNHDYDEIELNALGTEWDLQLPKPYRDGGKAVNAWEAAGIKLAVHVDGTLNDPSDVDRGWSVEVAIPWPALAGDAGFATPPKDGEQWRVNFSRVEWAHTIAGKTYKKVPNRREDNWVWSPQGVVDMHRPERWGYVQFSTSPPGAAPYRPDPSGQARDRLMRIYHAQADLHRRTGAYADSLQALGMADDPAPVGESRPEIRLTADGFEASITLDAREGKPSATWVVRQDSRLRKR